MKDSENKIIKDGKQVGRDITGVVLKRSGLIILLKLLINNTRETYINPIGNS